MSDVMERLNRALEGRYRIERDIGEGGMATVWLAHDLRHERRVALKVLKPELAAVVGAERFLAEIKTTANLQHPHILPLYDSGEADHFLFYVMPYVEGETLRDRLDREKQLPVDEAVRFAVAIAGALDYAHRHGIVHRDIKPGNILMQADQPVVGDFGIALAVGSAGGARLTETGLSVGTPYYMSPEQATGDVIVGPASDTYALAAVLYELLTGEPPYTGTTAQAVLGRIIQGAPVSATAVRRTVPAHVDAAIRKGLERLPADRFLSAQDFARALGDPAFRHGEGALAGAGAGGRFWNRGTVALAALAAVSTAGLAWSVATADPEPAPRAVERFESPLRADQRPFTGAVGREMALSPDGTFLVYLGPPSEDASVQLWIRRWDDPVATPLRGTQIGLDPAVSPDGSLVAYTQGSEVKVMPLAGGPTRSLGPGTRPWWGPDGFVYVTSGGGAVHRVPAAGGALEEFTAGGENEQGSRILGFFAGGRKALQSTALTDGTTEIRAVDVETREKTVLATGDGGRLSPTGHLLYLSEGTLLAAPIDLEEASLLGPAVALIENVGSFTLSETGKLFYAVGGGGGGRQELVWVSRTGEATPVDPAWQFQVGGSNAGWSLSPDGRRIALREATEDGLDIWVKELPGGPRSRLTFADAEDRKPIWGPEPGTVTYLSAQNGNLDVWARRADGTRDAQLVFDHEASIAEAVWSPDGTALVVRTAGVGGVEGGRDLMILQRGEDELRPLLAAPYDEIGPAFSPDGRWLAYTSNETGRYEVFVRPFPDVDEARWQVSTQGGYTPRWSPDTQELFFLDESSAVVAASFGVEGGAFQVLSREQLFQMPGDFVSSDIAVPYDVGRGERPFLMGRQYREDSSDLGVAHVLVLNFFEELRARVPR